MPGAGTGTRGCLLQSSCDATASLSSFQIWLVVRFHAPNFLRPLVRASHVPSLFVAHIQLMTRQQLDPPHLCRDPRFAKWELR
ncbi:unnamed protein product [Chondrus crispus]|uniref:Uncharacterized protein n=1 Tax=Chondrus crispus TaxID=2769 RepID=R7Q4B3_CHOCR|nr:unnamed protein product [Chondrus crispus]CDF33362.1 unnamed protein product [Chondrus crispus]|eukprot:XP_005713165.1 unnamed protein product [Chondrus crispus]